MISLVKPSAKVKRSFDFYEIKNSTLSFIGDRDPRHRAQQIINICDVTGNKKLTKQEVKENPLFQSDKKKS